ncbi:MAG: hypothetical protein A3E84_02895 [Gammaproteobacteria bacterium RIFCSPHIGHO2_12_FULL_42_13]|nr:MAG: hypothetical protein A3E84_02895 [Gammaproteobacteria bacterium RIFCSPHIGHO2_12_FULL_42_13]
MVQCHSKILHLKIIRDGYISRAEFIRMAIEHEINRWRLKQALLAMAKSFESMRGNKKYLREADEIMLGFDSPLPEEDEWWKK